MKSVEKAAKKPKKTTRQQSISKLKKAVQALANRYARERDCFGHDGAGCISCGLWKSFEELDGGHFIPTTSSALRFDERNINAQCTRCNRFLHGNPRHYAKGMVRKYGQDVVDDLESREFESKEWSIDELSNIRAYYTQKLKDLRAGKAPTDGPEHVSMSQLWANIPSPKSLP